MIDHLKQTNFPAFEYETFAYYIEIPNHVINIDL